MKRRRTAIIAFLVLAVATLSIGYAALTDILDIQGTAQVSRASVGEAYNVDVFFESVSVKMYDPDGNDVTAHNLNMPKNTAQITSDNDKATMTVDGLSRLGEKVTATFVIKNESAYPATVTLKSSNNTDTTNFEVTNSVGSGSALAAGGQIEVTVTVELLNIPGETTMSTSFTIELEAATADLP